MSNYIYTNGNLHNTDELKHWKYLKREKKNGKWRYYYSDKEYATAKKQHRFARDIYGEANAENKKYRQNVKSVHKEFESDGFVDYTEKTQLGKIDKMLADHNAQTAKIGKWYVEQSFKYAKIQIKSLPRRLIAKGASAVANLFESVKKKIKK